MAEQAMIFNGQFIFDNGDPADKKVVHLSVIPTHGINVLNVDVFNGDGVFLGTPFRMHMSTSDGRISADLPSVNSAHFIVDENGKIKNG